MKEPTVRTQKIHRNYLKLRLIIFGGLALALVIASYFSESLCPYDPYLQDLGNAKAIPSAAHLFGTDRYGRDMLSRVIVGSKTSIYSTLLLVGFIMVFGTMIGIFCAWSGKKIDSVLMRISDVFLAFPGLVFALAVAAALGGGVHNAIIALAVISWPKYARVARSQTLAQKETVYIKAARLSGCGTGKIILKHILPNIFGPILVTAVLDRYDDDGTGRSFLFGAWSKAADCRMGKHDERYKKSFNDSSMGNTGSRFCNLCIGCDF